MKGQHYALIEKEGCSNPLEIVSSAKTSRNGRGELEEIYQTYADLYPNPKLIEEKRQRDTLLQAARAASSVRQQQQQETTKSRKGFFTFLFGTREESTTKATLDPQTANDTESNDDDPIQYTDIPNEHDDGSLCGTQQSLDVSCIPPEVYNVARSHLTSAFSRRENPNALRWGPGSQLLTRESQDSKMFVVVGLGEIAEFGGSGNSSSSRILQTSDMESLAEYAQTTKQFDLSGVRGTILSNNCLAISWGFLDGITVVYRRKITFSNNGSDPFEGWEAVWWIGPSEPILENLANDGQDLYMDNSELPGSPLLKITDCVGLHVQGPPSQQEQNVVATLVVSRLGGYIELVPLPMGLWRGPILEKDARSRGRKRQHKQHYASGKKIVCPPNTLALTTFEYHLDVQALEVYRTNVNDQTEWNNEAYPDGPPAEFLLVASGVSVDGGYGETMTFWAISTLFASNEEGATNLDDFQLHSRLLEAIWTGTGAPISTFATPGIMSRWRTPRHVELKDTAASSKNEQGEDEDALASPKALAPVTTLSTTAPIVSMKFSKRGGSSSNGPFLSVLDWNGGVQIFDCSVVARLAEQSLKQHEYQQYRNMHNESSAEEQPSVDFCLVRCIMLRNQIVSALQKYARIPAVRNLHWLESNAPGLALPSLVFLLSRFKKLLVLSFDFPKDRHAEEPLKPSIVSVPFPVSGAAIESLAENSLSFVSLRIGSSKSAPENTIQRLRYFVMEQLQTMAIVETLARESKFEEAIQSASKLSKDEQDELAEVVVSCHRHLWETKRDTDSLIATNDEIYILGEVLAICGSGGNKNEFSLDDLRTLLKLALELVSSHGEEKERVRKAFLRLGTFELLSMYYESKPTLQQFQNEFLSLDMIDLSVELARRGDIPALSIVLYRHRFEVHDKLLYILGSLPLAMKSSSFSHLLPLIRNESVADLFLDSINEEITELPWSHMPQYILEKYLIQIAFDRFDEMVVLECNKLSNDNVEIDLLVDWFVKRANKMQTFVGNVDDVVHFAKVGMRCCSASNDGNTIDSDISSFQALQMTGRTASSLKRMLLDEAISIDGDGINTDDLMGMDLVELLDLVLDCDDESSVVRYRFDEYIQPLIMEMSVSSSGDHLDESLATYCLNKAKKCNEPEEAGAKEALISVVAIAEISNASLPEKNRLIKNEDILIGMILNVVDEISKNVEVAKISMNEKREIVESIWSLYETLPARLVTSESKNEEELGKIYVDLVGVDVLSRWRGCSPFTFFNRRRSATLGAELTVQEGNSLVFAICESFSSALSTISGPRDQTSLLQDLICDVQSLDKIVFKNSLDIAKLLCEYLIPSFLEQGHFGLIASFLGSDETVVDKKQVLSNVVEFIDEAMFAGGENMNRITNAMKCQDALEPLLPEIQSLFQSNRRYLDASHFISTVLLDGNVAPPLKPSDLKEMTPLDVLETVLQEFPECIGCRCSQWLDSEYAQNANKSLRQADANNELPDLPAGAVFHLATILGLESNISAVVVKSRVIYYALQAGYYGAGAAIARTLLHQNDAESTENAALDAIKLGAISDVISIENYHDLCTKKELCDAALRLFDGKVSFDQNESFNTILRVSSKLDFITSRFDQEVGILPPEKKKYLLSRPIARVYHHTFHEYSRDIHSLFKDLANQSSDGLVHDSLMDVLSKFIFYWLIHDSITTKHVVDLRYKADAEEILKIGCGLLLQIPSILTAENSLQELQEIALTQAGRVAMEERFEASNKFIVPHPDILRHLVQRGFTENAARRAATMTGNAGHNEAMAWAVGHAMDPDINNPLIMLKSPNRKMIDEDSIQVLQKSLIQLSNIIQDPLSQSAFLQNLQSGHGFVPIGVATQETSTAVKTKKARPLSLKKAGQKPKKKNELKPIGKNPSFEENGTDKPSPVSVEKTTDAKPAAPHRRKPPPPPPRRLKAQPKNGPVTEPAEIAPKDFVTSTEPKSKSSTAPIGNDTKTIANNATNVTAKSKIIKSVPKDSATIVKPKTKNSETAIGNDTKTMGIKGIKGIKAPPKPTVAKSAPKDSATSVKPKPNRIESVMGNSAKTIANKVIKATAKPTAMDREELLRKGKAALDKLKRGGKEPPQPSTGANVASDQKQNERTTPIAPPAPSRPIPPKPKRIPMDREALLKRGQEALNKMRSNKPKSGASNKPAGGASSKTSKLRSTTTAPAPPTRKPDDARRRLIEEGRQLLLQAKTNAQGRTLRSTSKAAAPKPARPPPPKPKLASKPAPQSEAVKLTASEESNDGSDAGWDFDDFDDF